MWNEPKEGIKAIATNQIYRRVIINPVTNVVKVNRYREEEKNHEESQKSFAGILQQKVEKKQQKTSRPKQEKLRVMGGLNQYDRYAREFCYILSNEADYKA